MTFFNKIVSFFEGIFGNSNWEKTASTTPLVVTPLVESIVTLTAGETDAAQVSKVVTEIQTDLTKVAALITSLQAGTATASSVTTEISAVLDAVQANLDSLLTAGHIKDPATLAKVESITTMIIGEVKAILAAMPTA
jgi:hypothetical protein